MILKGLPFITNNRYQDYNADGVNCGRQKMIKGYYILPTKKALLFLMANVGNW
jgi:hypothetical protein